MHRTDVRGVRLGVAAVLAAVTIWGFTNTLVKLSSMPALTFAVSRLWLGSLLLFTALTLSGQRLSWRTVRLSAAGGVLLGIEIAFFFSSLKHTSIADVSIISALQPALVLIAARPLFGEHIRRRQVGLTVISLLGVAIVTVGSSGTPVWSLSGDLLAVGSLFAWTAYFLVSKRARSLVPTLEYVTVVFMVAAVVVTPLAVVAGQPLVGAVGARDAAYLALFVCGASTGHVLVAWAHSRINVSVSSLLTLAQPVVAGVAALLILDEPLTRTMIAGGCVVIAALAVLVHGAAGTGEVDVHQPSDLPRL